jgi:hypothetical protein
MSIELLIKAFNEDVKTVREYIETPPNGVHGFISELHKHKNFLTINNIKMKLLMHVTPISELNPSLGSIKIPKIIHRVWFTVESNPTVPEEKFLATIKATVVSLDKSWKHYIWTNSEASSCILKKYFTSCENVSIRLYSSIKDQLILDKNIDKLILSKKMAFACDQFRIELIRIYGGIYCDVGVLFKRDIEPLLRGRNYLFLLSSNLFFQNSLFGAPKGDALFDLLVRINQKPSLFPREVLGDLNPKTEGYMASGLAITLYYLLLITDNEKPLILIPNKNLIQWGSQKSWYSQSKTSNVASNNVLIQNSSLTLINEDEMDTSCLVNL